jgi:5-methylcytosine-specific restriction protein A
MTHIKQQPPRIGATIYIERRREKQTDPFYRTYRWRRFAEHIVNKRGRRCERCGVIPPIDKRVFVDHIIELRDGGAPFDEDNVEVLDGSCHTTKTLYLRGERM